MPVSKPYFRLGSDPFNQRAWTVAQRGRTKRKVPMAAKSATPRVCHDTILFLFSEVLIERWIPGKLGIRKTQQYAAGRGWRLVGWVSIMRGAVFCQNIDWIHQPTWIERSISHIFVFDLVKGGMYSSRCRRTPSLPHIIQRADHNVTTSNTKAHEWDSVFKTFHYDFRSLDLLVKPSGT